MKFARFALLTSILVGSLFASTMIALASPGDLDPTFSGDGKVTDGLAYGWDLAKAVAIQADGKIVAAGSASPWSLFGVIRYNPDGSLDESFGHGGKVATEVGSQYCGANSLVIQTDGKIVVAGWSYGTSKNVEFAVVRYNPDGSLDNSFSGGLITMVMARPTRRYFAAVCGTCVRVPETSRSNNLAL